MKKESGMMMVVAFLVITVGILNLGLFFGFLIWGAGRILGSGAGYFSIIEALSTAVAAAAVFGAGFIAYHELKDASRTRHLEGVDKVFNEFNSDDKIKDRRIVYRIFLGENPKSYEDLTEEELDAIKSVLNSLDRVAFFVYADEDWVPEEIVMPWMHPIIHKCWRSLEGYVRYEQERRAEPFFYEHAQRLGKACAAWREKKGILDTIKLVK